MQDDALRSLQEHIAAREEGRRDVLAEIAALQSPCSMIFSQCVFCGQRYATHSTGCLWLRAQAVVNGE
jgi:hypothetical protein